MSAKSKKYWRKRARKAEKRERIEVQYWRKQVSPVTCPTCGCALHPETTPGWHHVAATFEGGLELHYVDGVLVRKSGMPG